MRATQIFSINILEIIKANGLEVKRVGQNIVIADNFTKIQQEIYWYKKDKKGAVNEILVRSSDGIRDYTFTSFMKKTKKVLSINFGQISIPSKTANEPIKLRTDPITKFIEKKKLNIHHEGMKMIISNLNKDDSVSMMKGLKKTNNIVLIRDSVLVSFSSMKFYENYKAILIKFFFGLNNATKSTQTRQESI